MNYSPLSISVSDTVVHTNQSQDCTGIELVPQPQPLPVPVPSPLTLDGEAAAESESELESEDHLVIDDSLSLLSLKDTVTIVNTDSIKGNINRDSESESDPVQSIAIANPITSISKSNSQSYNLICYCCHIHSSRSINNQFNCTCHCTKIRLSIISIFSIIIFTVIALIIYGILISKALKGFQYSVLISGEPRIYNLCSNTEWICNGMAIHFKLKESNYYSSIIQLPIITIDNIDIEYYYNVLFKQIRPELSQCNEPIVQLLMEQLQELSVITVPTVNNQTFSSSSTTELFHTQLKTDGSHLPLGHSFNINIPRFELLFNVHQLELLFHLWNQASQQSCIAVEILFTLQESTKMKFNLFGLIPFDKIFQFNQQHSIRFTALESIHQSPLESIHQSPNPNSNLCSNNSLLIGFEQFHYHFGSSRLGLNFRTTVKSSNIDLISNEIVQFIIESPSLDYNVRYYNQSAGFIQFIGNTSININSRLFSSVSVSANYLIGIDILQSDTNGLNELLKSININDSFLIKSIKQFRVNQTEIIQFDPINEKCLLNRLLSSKYIDWTVDRYKTVNDTMSSTNGANNITEFELQHCTIALIWNTAAYVESNRLVELSYVSNSAIMNNELPLILTIDLAAWKQQLIVFDGTLPAMNIDIYTHGFGTAAQLCLNPLQFSLNRYRYDFSFSYRIINSLLNQQIIIHPILFGTRYNSTDLIIRLSNNLQNSSLSLLDQILLNITYRIGDDSLYWLFHTDPSMDLFDSIVNTFFPIDQFQSYSNPTLPSYSSDILLISAISYTGIDWINIPRINLMGEFEFRYNSTLLGFLKFSIRTNSFFIDTITVRSNANLFNPISSTSNDMGSALNYILSSYLFNQKWIQPINIYLYMDSFELGFNWNYWNKGQNPKLIVKLNEYYDRNIFKQQFINTAAYNYKNYSFNNSCLTRIHSHSVLNISIQSLLQPGSLSLLLYDSTLTLSQRSDRYYNYSIYNHSTIYINMPDNQIHCELIDASDNNLQYNIPIDLQYNCTMIIAIQDNSPCSESMNWQSMVLMNFALIDFILIDRFVKCELNLEWNKQFLLPISGFLNDIL